MKILSFFLSSFFLFFLSFLLLSLFISFSTSSTLSTGAEHVVFEGCDYPFDASIPLERALDRNKVCQPLEYRLAGLSMGFKCRRGIPGT